MSKYDLIVRKRRFYCLGVVLNRLSVESGQSSPLIQNRPAVEFPGVSVWILSLSQQISRAISVVYPAVLSRASVRGLKTQVFVEPLTSRDSELTAAVTPAKAGKDQTQLAVLQLKMRLFCITSMLDPIFVPQNLQREPYLEARISQTFWLFQLVSSLLENCIRMLKSTRITF